MSYPTFAYSDLHITPDKASLGKEIEIGLVITNTDRVADDKVVQLYTHDEYASLPRPVKEFKGFYQVRIDPGQSRTDVFHLPVALLTFYDEDLGLVV